MRQVVINSPAITMEKLVQDIKELREYVEEIITDQNEINEDTRMQLELINEALAELQAQKKISEKPRKPIGFRIK